jgi:two-component system response regulator HydG
MCDGNRLDVADIPPEIYQMRQLTAGRPKQDLTLSELEKQAIIDTLAKTGNNRQIAAKILGIGERTLYRKIKEYNING